MNATPTDTKTVLGYALLLSAPIGAGVALAIMRMTGDGPLNPLVGLPGVVTAAAVFLFVLAAARGGSPDNV